MRKYAISIVICLLIVQTVIATEKFTEFRIDTSGSDDYVVEFTNSRGNTYRFPIVHSPDNDDLKTGNDDDNFIYKEEGDDFIITRDDYFLITQDGKSHVLRYRGSDIDNNETTLKFDDLSDDDRIKIKADDDEAVLKIASESYDILIENPDEEDSAIAVDLNGDGDFDDYTAEIVTEYGVIIRIDELDNDELEMTLHVPSALFKEEESLTWKLFADNGEVDIILDEDDYDGPSDFELEESNFGNKEGKTAYGVVVNYYKAGDNPAELVLKIPDEFRGSSCEDFVDEDGCKITKCKDEESKETIECPDGKPIPANPRYIIVVGDSAPSSDVVAIANFAATMNVNYGADFVSMLSYELLEELDDIDLERTMIIGVQGSKYSIMRGSKGFMLVMKQAESYLTKQDYSRLKLIGPYKDVVKMWITDWLVTGEYPTEGVVYDDEGYINYAVEKMKYDDQEDEPEIEETEPEQLICSSGCVMGGKCIPFGQRADNTYCDFTGEFTNQKEDGTACENSYECATNSCRSGTCIDLAKEIRENRNMLIKIISWLGGLFGLGS